MADDSGRRKFPISFKLQVLEFMDCGNNAYQTKQNRDGTDYQNQMFSVWYRNRDKIRSTDAGKARISGGGRKPTTSDLSEQLSNTNQLFTGDENMDAKNQVSFCRICLQNSPDSVSVGEVFKYDNQRVTIQQAFHDISGYIIEESEPQQFCRKCLKMLKVSYEFRMLYERARERLDVPEDFPVKTEFIQDDSVDIVFAIYPETVMSKEEEQFQEIPFRVPQQQREGNMTCPHCGKTFLFIKSFERHCIEKHGKARDVECSNCKQLQVKEALSRHEILCKPNLKDSTSCPYCQSLEVLDTPAKLQRHTKRYHKDKATIKCPTCETFVVPEVADFHLTKCNLRRRKPRTEGQICPYCGISLQRHSMSVHIKEFHGDRKGPYLCDLCGFETKAKTTLSLHMKRKHLMQLFKCKHCGQGDFKNYSAVVTHLHRAHEDLYPQFKCTQCDFQSPEKSTLNSHMKRHLGEKAKNHRCDICGKAFYMANKLKQHKQYHSDERNYVCEICGSAYKTKNAVYVHKQIHNQSKDYECPVCPKAYSTNQQLKLHVKKIHPTYELPPPGTIVKKTLRKNWSNVIQPF